MTPARRHRVWAGAALLAIIPLGLAACSSVQDGQALAQQACVHVNRSVVDWVDSQRAGTPAATTAALQQRAEQQLRLALPLAAAANSDDGTWNALMTAISESATVDETHLIPSLRGQCAVADTNVNINPQNPQNQQNPQNPQKPANTPNTANVNPRSPGS